MSLTTVTFGGGVEVAGTTVMSRSTAPAAPRRPQHLTCRMCSPSPAITLALITNGALEAALVDLLTMVVAPLSREYPIETVFFESQEVVAARRLNGEVTWEPEIGDVTVMADMVAVLARNARMGQRADFISCPRTKLGANFVELARVPAGVARSVGATDCVYPSGRECLSWSSTRPSEAMGRGLAMGFLEACEEGSSQVTRIGECDYREHVYRSTRRRLTALSSDICGPIELPGMRTVCNLTSVTSRFRAKVGASKLRPR